MFFVVRIIQPEINSTDKKCFQCHGNDFQMTFINVISSHENIFLCLITFLGCILLIYFIVHFYDGYFHFLDIKWKNPGLYFPNNKKLNETMETNFSWIIIVHLAWMIYLWRVFQAKTTSFPLHYENSADF